MEITIPTSQQVTGESSLQIFKTFGLTAAPTDLAALQYCWVFPRGKTIENKRSGSYYIQLDNSSNLMDAPIISTTGERSYLYLSNPNGGVRPIIPASETEKITPTSTRILEIEGRGSVQIVTFGEYPQKIADSKTQSQLNTLYFAGLKLKDRIYSTQNQTTIFTASFQKGSYAANGSPLKKTLQKFTLNDRIPNSYDGSFLPRIYRVYRLEDKKYIYFSPLNTDDTVILSSGAKIPNTKIPVWVEVQPIKWLVDPSGPWVAKDILFSNIQMDDKSFQQRTGLFKKSSLCAFLKDTFATEILPPVRIARHRKTIRTNTSRQRNG